MSVKNAPSGATAKPCLPLTTTVPVSFIDDAILTLQNVRDFVFEEMQVRVGSISSHGTIIGQDDEFAVDYLRDVAEAAASYCAVCELIDELESIKRDAQSLSVESPRKTISELTSRFKSSMPDAATTARMIREADAAALRIRSRDLRAAGKPDLADQILAQAFLLDGNLEELQITADGMNPEVEAVERLAKRDGNRGPGSRK